MNNFKLVSISENVLLPHSYRAEGEIKLNLDDLVEANNLDDSVALGRSPISQNISLTFSEQNSFSLTRPFEIPLRSMLSKECKNLFLNGSSASSSELTSRSLGFPNVVAQMGTAIGTISYLCLSQNRLPKTLSKKGYIDQIRNELYKSNHIFRSKVLRITTIYLLKLKQTHLRPLMIGESWKEVLSEQLKPISA